MAIIGDAFIAIRPDADGFESETEKQVGGAFGKVGKIATAAAAATGAAVAGVAAKGIGEFSGFQKGMQEVFTLLPGASADAMGEMEDDVLEFSKQAGVLPEETIPSLYSALSAGVPKDNVFDFMETANKAALGGVTNLETAVDGISGVVNAYGDDVIDADTASDVMFSTVRLGKTTFEELSGSLGDVTPLAGALGISFEEVGAAMAASTAITGNTAKSTTGLKGLLSELGKEGTVAGKAFEDIAGESFPDFIASGGDLQGALGLMAEHADDTGGSLVDMFGSVEAGQSALQLTGSDAFNDNLAEMQGSAGATQAAFEGMDQGLSRSWDRIKSQASVALVGIGEALAPMVQQLADLAEDVIPLVVAAVERLPEIISSVVGAVQTAVDWFQRFKTPILAVAAVIAASYIPALVRATVATVVNVAKQIAAWVAARASALASIATQIAGIGRLIARMAWMGAQSLIHAAKMAAAWVVAMGPIGWVIAGVVALVALIVANWDTVVEWTRKAWTWVTDKISQAWEWITTATGEAVTWISETVSGWVDAVVGFVQSLFDRWVALMTAIRDAVVGAVTTLVETVTTTVSGWVESIVGFVTDLFARWVALQVAIRDRVIELVGNLVAWVRETISGWVEALVGFVTNLRDRALALVTGLRDRALAAFTALKDRAIDVVRRLVIGLVTRFISIREKIVAAARKARDWVVEAFQALKDRAVRKAQDLVSWVRKLPSKIWNAIKSVFRRMRNAGRRIISNLIGGIREKITGIGRAMGDAAAKVTRFWPFSPAAEGPLRSHPPEAAGANIMSLMAEGMAGNVRQVVMASEAMARAASPDLDRVSIGAPTVGRQPAAAAQARDRAGEAGPMVGTVNIYTDDPKRAGDEVIRSLREQAYLNAPLGRS